MRQRWIYEPLELSVPQLLLPILEHFSDESLLQLDDLADDRQFHGIRRRLPLRLNACLYEWRRGFVFRGQIGKRWPYL